MLHKNMKGILMSLMLMSVSGIYAQHEQEQDIQTIQELDAAFETMYQKVVQEMNGWRLRCLGSSLECQREATYYNKKSCLNQNDIILRCNRYRVETIKEEFCYVLYQVYNKVTSLQDKQDVFNKAQEIASWQYEEEIEPIEYFVDDKLRGTK